MKVVLFCGGFGTRLKEHSGTIPKPMVEIGHRPIMWHLMRYYAHFGHKDFVLCLGYRGDYIKQYFLNYDECLSNDFVLRKGGKEVRLYNNDIEDWSISFVDTGINSNLGQRLIAVKDHLEGDDVFMVNYADALTDLDLARYLDHFCEWGKVASVLSVKSSLSFHVISEQTDGLVKRFEDVRDTDLWINGGFFVFRKEIFDYIKDGEDLVAEPFQRLIADGELVTFRNDGFWACMDTFKEWKMFDDLYTSGEMPWALWESSNQETKRELLALSRKAAHAMSVQDRSRAVYDNHRTERVFGY